MLSICFFVYGGLCTQSLRTPSCVMLSLSLLVVVWARACAGWQLVGGHPATTHHPPTTLPRLLALEDDDRSPFMPTGDWDDTPVDTPASPEEGAWGGPVAEEEDGEERGLWGSPAADEELSSEPAWLSTAIHGETEGPRQRIKAVKVGKVMGCFARRNGFHVEVVMQHELDETLPKSETTHRLWIADEVLIETARLRGIECDDGDLEPHIEVCAEELSRIRACCALSHHPSACPPLCISSIHVPRELNKSNRLCTCDESLACFVSAPSHPRCVGAPVFLAALRRGDDELPRG